MTHTPQIDERGFVRESDVQARNLAVQRIGKLTALASAIHAMIDEEQRLIGANLPFADAQYDRAFSALCRSGFGVFHADELHEMAVAYDPDWIDETVTPIRAGLCRGSAA